MKRKTFGRRVYLNIAASVAMLTLVAACGGSGSDDQGDAGASDAPTSSADGADSGDAGEPGGDTDDGDTAGDPPSAPSGKFVAAFSQEPASLDFMATSNGNVHEKVSNIVEGMFAPANDWSPVPMLVAETEVNDDNTEWNFTLRSGVKFHNGQDLTAADAVASLKRWISVDSRTDLWLESLTSLEATDDLTVTFTFSAPTPQLESFLADKQTGIIPGDLAEAAGTDVLPVDSIVGTGPYQLESWDTGKSMILKPFADYQPVDAEPNGWSGEKHAYFEEIELKPIGDPDARFAGMQAGQFQFADAIPYDKYQEILSAPNFGPANDPDFRPIGTGAAYFSSKSELVKDPRVRHAILLGLDMEEIGQSFGAPELWNLSPALPTSKSQFASDIASDEWNKHDVEAAKALLAETDYNGEMMTIIASANTPESVSAGLMLKEQMGRIGINADFKSMESASLQAMRASAEGWELAIGTQNATRDMTQQTVIACENTVGGYCSEEMNDLVVKFLQATDRDAQQAAHDAIQELVYKDLPYIKLPETSRLDIVSDSVHFTTTSMPQFRFYNTWFNE